MATFFYTSGEDEIFAEGSGNEYFGLEGNDTLEGNSGDGDNLLDGGKGRDELLANTEDVLRGDRGNDILDARGGSGGNILLGGQDNDVLFGGDNDFLFGGFGIDFLFAGSGNTLTGGDEGDQFWLVNAELPSTLITVTDFQGDADVLGFSLQGEIDSVDDLTFTQQDDGVLISYTAQDIALIRGVETAALTPENIVIAGVDPLNLDVPPEADPVLNPPAPVGTQAITLTPLTTVAIGEGENQVAEIVAYDATTQRFFVTNTDAQQVEILDGSDPSNLSLMGRLNFAAGVNSVTANDGLIAVAVENANPQEPGEVVFFDAAVDPNDAPTPLATVTVGALPNRVTFTPDGTKVLVANEGEPNDDYTVDPEGSVSIIEVNRSEDGIDPSVTNVGFADFNDQIDSLREAGVRIFGPGATVAQDLEPENIAVSADGSQAFVTLQENNAIAILDIASATITDIVPLGTKDYEDGLAAEIPFSDFVVFGDSYSDTGNISELTQGAVPPSPPYFDGRLSNGLITPDYLAQSLGLELDAEDNYAVAGAATDQGNTLEDDLGGVDLPGLQDQIAQFTAQVGAGVADPEALYLLWVNASELFDPFLTGTAPTDADITNAVDNVISAVTSLIDLGAENLVVPLALDRGITPFADAFAQAATDVTIAYNNQLEASLESLEDSVGGDVDLIIPDFLELTNAVVNNPEAFGFSNVTDSFLAAVEQDPNAEVEDYLFFDQNHATTEGHEILAGFLQQEIIGFTLDPSDEDGGINLRNAPVFGLLQPDGISSFEIAGETYYAIANEGDARDFDGFSEEARVADVTLDPEAFPNAAQLQLDENLGRLKITTTRGDTDGDGDFDELYAFGGRSFSILDSDGEVIFFDSGDDFARITATLASEIFNSNGTPDTFDERSDDKGAEPESVVTGQIGERVFAFIALERTGGIMVYEVTDPADAEFVQYINNEEDISPEGLEFIPAVDSPTGEPLLAVANEVSGTTTIYNIEPGFPIPAPVVPDQSFDLVENRPEGFVVGVVEATDLDEDELTFAIASGNPDLDGDGISAFRINDDGEILVNDRGDLNFEDEFFNDNDPIFNLSVVATDSEGNEGTGEVTIELLDQPSARVGDRNVFDFDGLDLLFNLSQSEASFLNEIGLFFVDNVAGEIGDISPDDDGYLEAVFDNPEVIFSTLADAPEGFDQSALERIISGASLSGELVGFYLVQNSTTDLVQQALESGGVVPDVFFGTTANAEQFLEIEALGELDESGFQLFWEDKPGDGDGDFNDLIVNVTTTVNQNPANQPQGEVELFDLRNFTAGDVEVEFSIYREARFDNFVGFYTVENQAGVVDSLDPTGGVNTTNYLDAVINNIVGKLDPIANGSAQTSVTLQGDSLIAPFILTNIGVDDIGDANFQDFLTDNRTALTDGEASNGEVYFPYIGANADSYDHIRLLADNTFGFEDLPNGGDNDYNDLIIQATFA
jgi:phospholipase/lecithinase/hemolysin